jgi:hypothetical protein
MKKEMFQWHYGQHYCTCMRNRQFGVTQDSIVLACLHIYLEFDSSPPFDHLSVCGLAMLLNLIRSEVLNIFPNVILKWLKTL